MNLGWSIPVSPFRLDNFYYVFNYYQNIWFVFCMAKNNYATFKSVLISTILNVSAFSLISFINSFIYNFKFEFWHLRPSLIDKHSLQQMNWRVFYRYSLPFHRLNKSSGRWFSRFLIFLYQKAKCTVNKGFPRVREVLFPIPYNRDLRYYLFQFFLIT